MIAADQYTRVGPKGETMRTNTQKALICKEYLIVNNHDGNDSFTVQASTPTEAAHRALEVLGWWVAQNDDKEIP